MRKKPFVILIILLICIMGLLVSCSQKREPEPEPVNSPPPPYRPETPKTPGQIEEFEVTSSAFKEEEMIPKKYTADGKDVTPPLKWSKLPDGSNSVVIICEDPDAPNGTWTHWIMYNIKQDMPELREELPIDDVLSDGSKYGKNSWGRQRYNGPAPPPGKEHRYFFKIYALDKLLDLDPGASRKEVEKKMEGHVIGEGQLMGKYKR